ncbi:13883_t:CDS:2 [Dentiscutata heterogama]|uniref:13883_t:CDS:1 n=1 Tax=Dentiscutata heterogama TaxID=1316150 RepID=A0ACA9N2H1_9GLOM|nr:13883_t:CDS:2 [Dentiscutata heterogama]
MIQSRALKEENSALRSQVALLKERLEHLERTQSNVSQSSAIADLLIHGRENPFSPGKSYNPTQTRFKHRQLVLMDAKYKKAFRKEVLRAAKQLAHKNPCLSVNKNKSWLHQRDFVELTILFTLKKRINKSLKYLDEEVVRVFKTNHKSHTSTVKIKANADK